jgi:hypothetical protein
MRETPKLAGPRITAKSLILLALDGECRRGDSNPHELPHTALNRARLPVPPLRPELSDNNDMAKRAPGRQPGEEYFLVCEVLSHKLAPLTSAGQPAKPPGKQAD